MHLVKLISKLKIVNVSLFIKSTSFARAAHLFIGEVEVIKELKNI